jgi:hypothetical protein
MCSWLEKIVHSGGFEVAVPELDRAAPEQPAIRIRRVSVRMRRTSPVAHG